MRRSGTRSNSSSSQTASTSKSSKTGTSNGESSLEKSVSESEESLTSLAKYLENHVQPCKGEYDEFATSYITSVIPIHRIYHDETDSFKADLPPFKTAFKIKEFVEQETRRNELGESSRKEKLIPASKFILKEIHNTKLSNAEQQKMFLFYKARQWCEVNKALATDLKYPKISRLVLRNKYSEEHQNATKQTRKLQGLTKKKVPIFDSISVSPFPIPLELLSKKKAKVRVDSIPGYQDMVAVIEKEEAQQSELRETLAALFEDIKPIPGSQVTEEPWQFKVLKTKSLPVKPKQITKQFWKKTEYPPKSKTEKILELRKLLPEPKPENLQTDYLSGIWEPELMTDEFTITPLNYDSRLIVDKDKKQEADQIDWFVLNEAKEKCKNWLETIPEPL